MSFYTYVTDRRDDSAELKQVMESVTSDLMTYRTDDLKPGILLGQIQSGKTRAFVGIIARSFDNAYDISIVLTKNSVALVQQTIKRLNSEFEMPVQRNRLFIWDIIGVQDAQLTGYVAEQKQIFVVKKEVNNMKRLLEVMQQPTMANKRILIVDDEADQASVGFVSDKKQLDDIDFATIAKQLSVLRNNMGDRASYLQVTATPYSLYLQPEDNTLNLKAYPPNRPAFTHILKPHGAYIGGKYYFEDAQNGALPASYIHVQVSDDELTFLNKAPKTGKKYDQRIIDNVLQTEKIKGLRFSIYNFLVGGAIRRLQDHSEDQWAMPYHCAMVIHTSTMQRIHQMQKDLIQKLIDKLTELSMNELKEHLRPSYHNLGFSIQANDGIMPSYDDIIDSIKNALMHYHIGIIEVNSTNQVSALLGPDGQLRLDNPFNIFVGGQSLDRGITIDHLIGFFYGRNPNTFQMDTVLQHSRMYGSRSQADLAVTRFYTNSRVYQNMRQMYWFDHDLRQNIEKDITSAVARFISKQGKKIIPTGPNKIKASDLISFKAFSRLLPIGFQTGPKTTIEKDINEIDELLQSAITYKEEYLKLSFDQTKKIISLIRKTFVYEDKWNNYKLDWDIDPFVEALRIALELNKTDDVIIYHKTNRNAARLKSGGTSFGDAPDDGRTDLPICRELANKGPVLMLLKQKGLEKDGWRESAFYYPVMIMPGNMPNYIYCKD